MLRRCSKCGGRFPESDFYAVRKSGLRRQCKACVREDMREYKRQNPEKVRKAQADWYDKNVKATKASRNGYMREYNRRPDVMAKRAAARAQDKRSAFEHYGGAFCACCGEIEMSMLTLDHKEGGGNKHRRALTASGEPSMGSNIYGWVRVHGYPPIFRVLCYNCNCARSHNNGICPHEIARQELLALADSSAAQQAA